jgi:hypothetical protein
MAEIPVEEAFGSLGASVMEPINVDAYDFRPFSEVEGNHTEAFLDELVVRLKKLPDVGALPTYIYIPKSLGRRYARQVILVLKWWLRECDKRQVQQKSFETANFSAVLTFC